MTITAFFQYLQTVIKPGQWVLRNNRIRHKRSGCCPLSFAARQRCHKYNDVLPSEWITPARRFGMLTNRVGFDLMKAADNHQVSLASRARLYRRRLLAYTGLA